ncbi:DNA glycosylase [Haematococcus lacustris]
MHICRAALRGVTLLEHYTSFVCGMAPKRARAGALAARDEDKPSPKPKKMKPLVQQPSVDVAALRDKAQRILGQLQALYPDPSIPLNHTSTFQLLVAVMLSAQSTDAKVNTVTPALFKLAPTPQTMARTQVSAVEGVIKVLGLAATKARNLVAMSQLLLDRHQGQVPDSFQELEALPGIGHKTASVVMAQAFGQQAFPVDTHIHRLAQRWGLTAGGSVEQTEADLKALLPQDCWREAHLQIIYFGREHCPAVGHDPAGCPVCSWAAVPPYDR